MHFEHLLIFASMIGTTYSLTCNACDDFISCSTPFPEQCPPHAKCYTQTGNNPHQVLAKGCAHSCDNLPYREGSFCTTCHHADFCNDRGHAIGRGVEMGQRNGPGIGGGVVVDNGYNIGGGVRPRSAAQFSTTGSILTMAIYKYFF